MTQIGTDLRTGYGLTAVVRQAVLKAYGFECQYCNGVFGKAEHVDHIIARCNGGPDDLRNYTAACVVCNLRKSGKKLPENWHGLVKTVAEAEETVLRIAGLMAEILTPKQRRPRTPKVVLGPCFRILQPITPKMLKVYMFMFRHRTGEQGMAWWYCFEAEDHAAQMALFEAETGHAGDELIESAVDLNLSIHVQSRIRWATASVLAGAHWGQVEGHGGRSFSVEIWNQRLNILIEMFGEAFLLNLEPDVRVELTDEQVDLLVHAGRTGADNDEEAA